MYTWAALIRFACKGPSAAGRWKASSLGGVWSVWAPRNHSPSCGGAAWGSVRRGAGTRGCWCHSAVGGGLWLTWPPILCPTHRGRVGVSPPTRVSSALSSCLGGRLLRGLRARVWEFRVKAVVSSASPGPRDFPEGWGLRGAQQ